MRYEPDFGRGWIKREFGQELRAFWRYLHRPRLSPRRRCPDDAPVWLADWLPSCPWRLLLAWLLFLWGVSILILGPVIAWAAAASGAEHRLAETVGIPVVLATVVAPVAEELVFRYLLRRLALALCLLPLGLLLAWVVAWLSMLRWLGAALGLAMVVVVSCRVMHGAARRGRLGLWGWRWRRVYVRYFAWVFHGCALSFAVTHLLNYQFSGALWLAPLMILPQWLSGLVLGWMRVCRSLGSAIALHACFNSGPVLLAWGLQKYLSNVQ